MACESLSATCLARTMRNDVAPPNHRRVLPKESCSLEFEIGSLGAPMRREASEPLAHPEQVLPPLSIRLAALHDRVRLTIWNVVSGELVRFERMDKERQALVHEEIDAFYRPFAIALETAICMLIVANVVGVCAVGTPRDKAFIRAFDTLAAWTTGALLLEYALRLWTCVEDPRYRARRGITLRGRLRWMWSANARIDILVALPYSLVFFIPSCMSCRLTDYAGSECNSCWSWEFVRLMRITCCASRN